MLLLGHETSSSAATFALYELALNQEIQDRLRNEISEVASRHDGEITYDGIMEMKYLDMVFNETLRKFPVVDTQFRKCTTAFRIPNSNLIVPEGVAIMIPVHALHRDESFYDNPDQFDPERFTDENVKKRKPFTYLPFGKLHNALETTIIKRIISQVKVQESASVPALASCKRNSLS